MERTQCSELAQAGTVYVHAYFRFLMLVMENFRLFVFSSQLKEEEAFKLPFCTIHWGISLSCCPSSPSSSPSNPCPLIQFQSPVSPPPFAAFFSNLPQLSTSLHSPCNGWTVWTRMDHDQVFYITLSKIYNT